MNSKNGSGGFFDKFKKIIGLSSENETKNKKPLEKKEDEKKIKPSVSEKKDDLKKTNQAIPAAIPAAIPSNSNENEDESEIRVGKSPAMAKKQEENEGKPTFDSGRSSSLTEKFQKKGIGPKKSLKEIAEEAEKKKKEEEGKAFAEGDAAQKALKAKEQGFEKVVKKKRNPLEGKVFLVRGKDNGRAAWHYVLVSKEKEMELKKQRAGTNIDVADYGKIIKSGWGEEPSDEIKKEIEEEYGT